MRHYIPPPPSTQIEQVEAKLLGVLLTPTLSMQSHVKYTISLSNQRLYILYQLRKQGLNVIGLTQVFMALVVAWFQYALPALAGQTAADDLHKVDAVFSKARRWQLTSHTPNSGNLIEQCDKHLFRAALNPTHCVACCPRQPLNPPTVCIACCSEQPLITPTVYITYCPQQPLIPPTVCIACCSEQPLITPTVCIAYCPQQPLIPPTVCIACCPQRKICMEAI